MQLRDHAKLYGKRDVRSGRVLVPPRAFSDQTLEPTTEWVEVGPGGKIETFSIIYEEFNGLPPPYAFGYVQLDGADTALGGFFAASIWPIRPPPPPAWRSVPSSPASPSSAPATCWISSSSLNPAKLA